MALRGLLSQNNRGRDLLASSKSARSGGLSQLRSGGPSQLRSGGSSLRAPGLSQVRKQSVMCPGVTLAC